jgi:hypothetical protein
MTSQSTIILLTKSNHTTKLMAGAEAHWKSVAAFSSQASRERLSTLSLKERSLLHT